jgi:hypothetical protein
MTRQLELDINRPAWHEINYEPTFPKSWSEKAGKLKRSDVEKPRLTDLEKQKHKPSNDDKD